MKQTAADVLVDTLVDWGVEIVFGIPGDGINGIMEALRKRRDEIRFVQTRHEESAGLSEQSESSLASHCRSPTREAAEGAR